MYDALFQQGPTPLVVVEADGAIIDKNAAAASVLGRSPTAEWPNFYELFREGRERLRDDVERAVGTNTWLPAAGDLAEGDFAGMRIPLRLKTIRGEGQASPAVLVWLRINEGSPFREHTDLIRRLNRELAAQRELRIELEDALGQARYLHGELIHRVKNNLAILGALIRRRAAIADDLVVKEALAAIELRTRSIALVHDLLDRTNRTDVVEARDLIVELCELMRRSLVPENVTLECKVESLILHNEDATALCLLINELVTNSLKHAFAGQASGRIELNFLQNGVDKMELRVRDDGRGMPDAKAPEETSRQGIAFLQALAEQLRGELIHRDDAGTEWTLVFDPKMPLDVAAQ